MDQPVTGLAAVLQELIRREQRLDHAELKQKVDAEQIETYRRLNLEAVEGVEQAISCLSATTMREAVVQVLLAAGHVNVLEEDALDAPEAHGRIKAAVRLLRSALPVLAASADVDLKDYGARRYGHFAQPWPFMPPALDDDPTGP